MSRACDFDFEAEVVGFAPERWGTGWYTGVFSCSTVTAMAPAGEKITHKCPDPDSDSDGLLGMLMQKLVGRPDAIVFNFIPSGAG
ncbi:MAG: hypothetical protein WCH43_10710 [Verrucomicrobiota bacterium]